MLTVNKLIPQGQGLAAALLKRASMVELDWDVRQKSRFDTTDSAGRSPAPTRPDPYQARPDPAQPDPTPPDAARRDSPPRPAARRHTLVPLLTPSAPLPP